MPSCSIKQCGARKGKDYPTLTLHKFPENEQLKKKWLDIIGLKNLNTKTKMVYVCSLHFDETSFNRTLDVIRLREGAAPSPSHLPDETRSIYTPSPQSPLRCVISHKNNKQGENQSNCNSNLALPGENLTRGVSFTQRKQQREIRILREKCATLKKKVASLRQKVRQRDKKIDLYFDIINKLQEKKIIENETFILEVSAD